MAKKKLLKELDEADLQLIEDKMKRENNTHSYLTSCDLMTDLKTLSFKLDIKCKNERQKDFLNILKNKDKEISTKDNYTNTFLSRLFHFRDNWNELNLRAMTKAEDRKNNKKILIKDKALNL